jgi:intracellular sulfur oxidation DsrE/DsrF family protein
MNITKSMIQKRITVLDSDIQKSRQKMSELEQQRIESVALLNALMGAKQQCDNFLLQIDNVEPELVSDSSDVDSK